jgi:hypothetical protein
MTHPLIFHSRTKAEADWQCPRYRFYSYEFAGGIVKDALTVDLFLGTVLHDALAAIAQQHAASGMVNIDQIATAQAQLVHKTFHEHMQEAQWDEGLNLYIQEQTCLVEALIRGFHKHAWPGIAARFPTVVASERATIYPHGTDGKCSQSGPFVYCAKPDLILEGPDGRIYLELKSTSTKRDEWVMHWQTAMQVHGTLKSAEFTLGEEMLGAIVQGMYKGSQSFGKFSSALVYGYRTKSNPPFTKAQYSFDYRYGYQKFPVWEYEGGVKGWIDKMPAEILADQFPQTPLIFPDTDMAENFFRQRAIRERAVRDASATLAGNTLEVLTPTGERDIMDTYFPQNFGACAPSWGRGCAMYRVCHGPAKSDPLASGFIPKNTGHELEYHELAEALLTHG